MKKIKDKREYNELLVDIKNIFNEGSEQVENAEISAIITSDEESKPRFPIIMVTAGVLKDLLDIPLELSVVGVVMTTIMSAILFLILFIWILGKLKGAWWKKRMVKWLWRRFLLAAIIEFVPFLKIIPATTIIVLMTHYRETKLVRLLNLALEEFRGRGGLEYIKTIKKNN